MVRALAAALHQLPDSLTDAGLAITTEKSQLLHIKVEHNATNPKRDLLNHKKKEKNVPLLYMTRLAFE